MDDLISRQAAIDATRNATFSFTIKSDTDFANYRKEIQEIFNNVLDAQEKALNGLPSAQPEIIRCKDCKFAINADTDMMCGNPKSWVVATENDFGCILAERREQ